MSQELIRKLRQRVTDTEREAGRWQVKADVRGKRIEEAKEVIEGLLHQFAYDGPGPVLSTGGLSALEAGFEFVGWRDPHPIPESRCDEPGCIERSSCGWPSPSGYRRTCGTHWVNVPQGDGFV